MGSIVSGKAIGSENSSTTLDSEELDSGTILFGLFGVETKLGSLETLGSGGSADGSSGRTKRFP